MSNIKFSIRDYGFAVVLLHPHEYSKRSGWVFENRLDIPQYFELNDLVDEVREYGLNIVTIDDLIEKHNLSLKHLCRHGLKILFFGGQMDKSMILILLIQ